MAVSYLPFQSTWPRTDHVAVRVEAVLVAVVSVVTLVTEPSHVAMNLIDCQISGLTPEEALTLAIAATWTITLTIDPLSSTTVIFLRSIVKWGTTAVNGVDSTVYHV